MKKECVHTDEMVKSKGYSSCKTVPWMSITKIKNDSITDLGWDIPSSFHRGKKPWACPGAREVIRVRVSCSPLAFPEDANLFGNILQNIVVAKPTRST